MFSVTPETLEALLARARAQAEAARIEHEQVVPKSIEYEYVVLKNLTNGLLEQVKRELEAGLIVREIDICVHPSEEDYVQPLVNRLLKDLEKAGFTAKGYTDRTLPDGAFVVVKLGQTA